MKWPIELHSTKDLFLNSCMRYFSFLEAEYHFQPGEKRIFPGAAFGMSFLGSRSAILISYEVREREVLVTLGRVNSHGKAIGLYGDLLNFVPLEALLKIRAPECRFPLPPSQTKQSLDEYMTEYLRIAALALRTYCQDFLHNHPDSVITELLNK